MSNYLIQQKQKKLLKIFLNFLVKKIMMALLYLLKSFLSLFDQLSFRSSVFFINCHFYQMLFD